MIGSLPPSESVEVDCLAGLFRDCTQSYKFLFFRSILDAVRRGGQREVRFEDLLADMIVGAWWPVMMSRLNIGNAAANDTLTALVAKIDAAEDGASLDRARAVRVAEKNISAERRRGPLRYVPHRLLAPWATASTQPMYFVEPWGIVLEPRWLDYLIENLPIVQGWADHAWCNWVQSRNPNVPVTMEKLVPSTVRRSLRTERAFFMHAIQQENLQCIYTGNLLQIPLHIDHFLPRSFVGHDRIWNLLPTSLTINSSKGARIPSTVHVGALADFHVCALRLSRDRKESAGLLDQYCLDLRLTPNQLTDADAVRSAYSTILPAMMAIASRMGFPSGWNPTA